MTRVSMGSTEGDLRVGWGKKEERERVVGREEGGDLGDEAKGVRIIGSMGLIEVTQKRLRLLGRRLDLIAHKAATIPCNVGETYRLHPLQCGRGQSSIPYNVGKAFPIL